MRATDPTRRAPARPGRARAALARVAAFAVVVTPVGAVTATALSAPAAPSAPKGAHTSLRAFPQSRTTPEAQQSTPLAGALSGALADARAEQALTPREAVPGATTARIGQPIELVVTVTGGVLGRAADPKAGHGALEAAGWVVLDGPRDVSPTSRAWTLMALDPGQRATPDLEVTLAGGAVLTAPATALEVAGELADGEDAPRPARGFRHVEDTLVLRPGTFGAVVASVLVAGVLLALALHRRRSAVTMEARPPTPLERLAALDVAANPGAAVAALGPLLRAAVDQRQGAARAALTDDEWRASVAAGGALPRELVQRLDVVVARSGEARFSGQAPSLLGARELVDEARVLLETLATAPVDAGSPDARVSPAPRATAGQGGAA